MDTIFNKELNHFVSLGYEYNGFMCYTSGNYYVLSDFEQWPIGTAQTVIPKRMTGISKLITTFDGKKVVIPVKNLAKEIATKAFIDAVLSDNYQELIANTDHSISDLPIWNESSLIDLKNKLKSKIGDLPEDLIKDQQSLSKKAKGLYKTQLKNLSKNKYLVHNEISNKLSLHFGDYQLCENEVKYQPPKYLVDVNDIVIHISKRDFIYNLTIVEKVMSTNEFTNVRLPIVFNDLDIAGDKLSANSLDERSFMTDYLLTYARKLNINVKENERIMFRWSSIGDKIVHKLVSIKYPKGMIAHKEFGKVVSNKNMADTLVKMNVINAAERSKQSDHEWGTIYEALIYMTERNEQFDIRDRMIKSLIATARNW